MLGGYLRRHNIYKPLGYSLLCTGALSLVTFWLVFSSTLSTSPERQLPCFVFCPPQGCLCRNTVPGGWGGSSTGSQGGWQAISWRFISAEAAICAGNLFRFSFPEVLCKSTNYCSRGALVRCQEQITHIFGKSLWSVCTLVIKAIGTAGKNYRLIEISWSCLCFQRTNPIPLLQKKGDEAVPGCALNCPEAFVSNNTSKTASGRKRGSRIRKLYNHIWFQDLQYCENPFQLHLLERNLPKIFLALTRWKEKNKPKTNKWKKQTPTV